MSDSLSRRQWLGGMSASAVSGLAATCSGVGAAGQTGGRPVYLLPEHRHHPRTGPYPSPMKSIWPPRQASRPSSRGSTSWNAMSKEGGSLRDLGRRITDAGLRVPSSHRVCRVDRR